MIEPTPQKDISKRQSFVHLYYGNGKGKTTAAVGLAVRAIGCGKKVLFVQFLKDYKSCELVALDKFGNDILIWKGPPVTSFVSEMTPEEFEMTRSNHLKLFREALVLCSTEHFDMVVFDEIVDVVNLGILTIDIIEEFISRRPPLLEVVMTGHNPSQDYIDLCDYVSEIRKVKHPYDNGLKARNGIEK